MKTAHVTHPELKVTLQLEILGVKKNPNGQAYTSLGVVTKGTVIEVNVSELGLVTPGGKVVWGKYAQVTNNPENDGCINAVISMRCQHQEPECGNTAMVDCAAGDCVSPGFIKTNMTEKISDEMKNTLIARIPMNRLGTGEDVSNTVVFLSSELSSYITGETIHVNGGMYMA